MWKLTIIQKRKSEYSDSMMDEIVEFVGNNLEEICELIEKLGKHEGDRETTYIIERVEEGEKCEPVIEEVSDEIF